MEDKKITWPTKLIALSFISLIIITNIWLHYYLFGGDLPAWVHIAIDISTIALIMGAVSQFLVYVSRILSKSDKN